MKILNINQKLDDKNPIKPLMNKGPKREFRIKMFPSDIFNIFSLLATAI